MAQPMNLVTTVGKRKNDTLLHDIDEDFSYKKK